MNDYIILTKKRPGPEHIDEYIREDRVVWRFVDSSGLKRHGKTRERACDHPAAVLKDVEGEPE